MKEKTKAVDWNTSRLAVIVRIVGGKVQQDFEELVREANEHRTPDGALTEAEARASAAESSLAALRQKLRDLVGPTDSEDGQTPPATPKQARQQTVRPRARPERSGRKSGKSPRAVKKAHTPTSQKTERQEIAGKRLDAQWKLLEAAAMDERAFGKAKQEAYRAFNLKGYSRGAFVGAAMNQGSFSCRAIKGLSPAETEKVLERLAGLYSRIDGAPMTVEMLRVKLEREVEFAKKRAAAMNANRPRNKDKKK